MKFRYWTLTLQHDPSLLDRQGIGVVAEGEDGASAARIISTGDLRTNGMSDAAKTAARTVLDTLREELTPLVSDQPILQFGPSTEIRTFLNTANQRWNNFVEVQSDRTLAVDMELGEVVDYLFSMYIRSTPASHKTPQQRLQEKVWRAYEGVPQVAALLRRQPTTTFAGVNVRTDLALIDDNEVKELVRTVPFNIDPDPRRLQGVDAWTMRVFNLRKRGGQLDSRGESITLPNNVPVSVIYAPPKTREQYETFDLITQNWSDFQIESVSALHAKEHVLALAERI